MSIDIPTFRMLSSEILNFLRKKLQITHEHCEPEGDWHTNRAQPKLQQLRVLTTTSTNVHSNKILLHHCNKIEIEICMIWIFCDFLT